MTIKIELSEDRAAELLKVLMPYHFNLNKLDHELPVLACIRTCLIPISKNNIKVAASVFDKNYNIDISVTREPEKA